jgi:hypothetical protein
VDISVSLEYNKLAHDLINGRLPRRNHMAGE